MDVISFIPRLMFFTFVALTVVLLVRTYLTYTVEVRDAEIEVQANRILYSPACLAYYDETLERSYPGMVDLNKMQDVRLDNCIRYGGRNDFLTMNVSLRPVDGTEGSIAEAMLNAEGWDAWLPREGLPGPGGTYMRRVRRLVLYRQGNAEPQPAILDIQALVPNI